MKFHTLRAVAISFSILAAGTAQAGEWTGNPKETPLAWGKGSGSILSFH